MQKSLYFLPHRSLRRPQHWGLHACIFSALAVWGHQLIDSSQVCIAVNWLRFGYGWTVNRLHFLLIVRALVFSIPSCSLGLAGGKYYRKITISIFRLVLQNFAIPGYFPYILFYRYLFPFLSLGWFVIAVCGLIWVNESVKSYSYCKLM